MLIVNHNVSRGGGSLKTVTGMNYNRSRRRSLLPVDSILLSSPGVKCALGVAVPTVLLMRLSVITTGSMDVAFSDLPATS